MKTKYFYILFILFSAYLFIQFILAKLPLLAALALVLFIVSLNELLKRNENKNN